MVKKVKKKLLINSRKTLFGYGSLAQKIVEKLLLEMGKWLLITLQKPYLKQAKRSLIYVGG